MYAGFLPFATAEHREADQIKIGTATRPDNISPEAFLTILNHLLITPEFPKQWKTALIFKGESDGDSKYV